MSKSALPASCAHLDFAAVEAELVRTSGNVTAAARKLSVPAPDLRRLVWSSSLANTIYEQLEQTLDEALQVLHDGLKSNDKARRLQAATALLTQSEAGRRRGWGRA
jgi:hypothetical protein